MYRIYLDKLEWRQFEFLTLNYLQSIHRYNRIKWFGEAGRDGGIDLWCKDDSGRTYYYQCKNWRNLTFSSVRETIKTLATKETPPDFFIVVCGGTVRNKVRTEIENYVSSVLTENVEIWSGGEFEAKLRDETPELLSDLYDSCKERNRLKAVKHAINFEEALKDKPISWKPTNIFFIHTLLLMLSSLPVLLWLTSLPHGRIYMNPWVVVTAVVFSGYAICQLLVLHKNGRSKIAIEFDAVAALVDRIYSDIDYELRTDSQGRKFAVPQPIRKIQLKFIDGSRDTYKLPATVNDKIKEGDSGLAYISEFGRLVDMKHLTYDSNDRQVLV